MLPCVEKCLHDGKDRVKGDNGYHDDEQIIRDHLCFGRKAGRDELHHRTAEQKEYQRNKQRKNYRDINECRINL